ncbi:MAG: HlyD family efflux transporter periplasmic adaptor subunit [Bryobacterales bacterium]
MKKLAVRLLVLLILAGVAAGAYYLIQRIPKEEDDIPLAEVKRGDLEVRAYLRGELRAVRSITLTAPNLGSQSQVTQLAPAGALAKAKDLIVEFDDSERRAALEDDELEVQRIRENLIKAETDLDIRKSQDEVELVKARYAVTKAELENKKNELVGAIEARKNQLTLEEANSREQKLKEDIKSRLQQREAELSVLREQLNKAQLDADRERRRIDQARVLTPIAGLVSILENRAGGRGGFGQTTPAIREGDQIPAGMAVTQMLDLSEMELVAKVEEVERAALSEGQEAVIYLDALPGKPVTGKIKTLASTATTNVFRGEATKKFDTVLSLDMRQLLENVGASEQQITRILATARDNAQRGVFGGGPVAPNPGAAFFGAPGGGAMVVAGGDSAPSGGGGEGPRAGRQRAGGAGEGPGGAAGPGGAGGAAGGTPGQGRGGFGRNLSPEQREQMQKAMQEALGGRDPSQLSPEERRALFQKLRPQGARAGGGRGAGQAAPGGPGDVSPGGPAGGPASAPDVPSLSLSRPGAQGFTAEDRAQAKLPAPPEEGSDVDILLRPGLLANAEIIVERIPDTLYVPFHGVFEVGVGHVVYVKKGDTFEPRKVEVGPRSESQIAIKSGLEEGEQIALALPFDDGRAEKKKKAAEPAQPSFPGGGGGEAAPPAGGGRRRR